MAWSVPRLDGKAVVANPRACPVPAHYTRCVFGLSQYSVYFPDEEIEAQGAHLSYHSQRAGKCQSQEARDPSPSELPFLHTRQAWLF